MDGCVVTFQHGLDVQRIVWNICFGDGINVR